LPFRVVSKYP